MSPSRRPEKHPSIRHPRPALSRAAIEFMPPRSAAATAAFINVLLVSRDAATRASLGRWFGKHGYFVVVADDAEAADTLQSTIHFDLVVCDATAASHRARRWIEQRITHPPGPTIFLATHPTLDTAIRLANQPLAGYLAQPVDLAALERIVLRFLSQITPRAVPPLKRSTR